MPNADTVTRREDLDVCAIPYDDEAPGADEWSSPDEARAWYAAKMGARRVPVRHVSFVPATDLVKLDGSEGEWL